MWQSLTTCSASSWMTHRHNMVSNTCQQKNFLNEEIERVFLINEMTIILGDMRWELLHMKVSENISILRVFYGDGKKVLS